MVCGVVLVAAPGRIHHSRPLRINGLGGVQSRICLPGPLDHGIRVCVQVLGGLAALQTYLGVAAGVGWLREAILEPAFFVGVRDPAGVQVTIPDMIGGSL